MTRWMSETLPVLLALAAALVLFRAMPGPPAWAGTATGAVPKEIATYFTPQDVARGHAYMQGRYWFVAAGIAFRLALLLLLVLTPSSAALRNAAVRLSPTRPAIAVALYIAFLVLLFELLMLPLSYYVGFVREHAFGLSTQTPGGWLLDRLKAALLDLALAAPLGSLLVLLWRRCPTRWVLPTWILAGVAAVLLVALAPVVIDPLFTKLTPLQDPALRARVLALAQRAGIHVDQVYVSDASRRTRKGNAYFTGLGASKRIVIYDTLLAGSDPEAVELVLAHEMGHWKHAHIWKGLALTILGMGIGLWCCARVLAWAVKRPAFHIAGPADVAGLPLFLLTLFILSLLSLPIQTGVSRYFERQADWTALELTRNPQAFIRSEVDLARSNLADLNPPRVLVWLLYTHPPVAERIRMAESFETKTGAQP